jgi:8-oxo-dGTP pyrophosphatase MutT (NUDIX family)
MSDNYLIYFNGRKVFLRTSFPENPEQKYGLFHKYNGRKELYKVLHTFMKNKKVPTLLLVHDDMKKLWKRFKQYFIYIKAGGGFVQNEKGQFLVIKRKGVWDLPKGKTAKQESIKEAALREVSEESGIQNLKIISVLHTTYHSYSLNGRPALKKTRWYLMKAGSEEKLVPDKKERITKVKWISPKRADKILAECFPSIADVISKGLEG